VFHPADPNIAFVGSDGGVVRNDGEFVDNTTLCQSSNPPAFCRDVLASSGCRGMTGLARVSRRDDAMTRICAPLLWLVSRELTRMLGVLIDSSDTQGAGRGGRTVGLAPAIAAALLLLLSGNARSEATDDAPEQPSRPVSLGFGWDAGPTYELRWRSLLRHLAPERFAEESHLRGRVGGSLYLDGGYLGFQCCEDSGFAGAVRRARLYARGDLDYGITTEYKFEFAFEGRQLFLNDFYLRWRPSRFVDTIKIGYFDPNYSLGSIASSSARPLLETASPVSAFAPGYRSGIEIAKRYERPDLSWSMDLTSVGQKQNDGDASDSTLRFDGRIVWRPSRDDAAPESTLLHVGFDFQQEIAGRGQIRYRARPESFLSPYLVDTDQIPGNATSFDFEFAWRRGPLTIESEWFHSIVGPDDGEELYFSGIYAQAAWVLTGETRPYDYGSSVFGRIVPEHPFDLRAGTWGAFEVSGRASWLDLSDGSVRGGRMFSVSAGVVWTWNGFVRVLADYVFADVGAGPESNLVNIVQTRLEFVF
jgi:phosphate-selective porin OprO/OprP